jgi:hypothetical protein
MIGIRKIIDNHFKKPEDKVAERQEEQTTEEAYEDNRQQREEMSDQLQEEQDSEQQLTGEEFGIKADNLAQLHGEALKKTVPPIILKTAKGYEKESKLFFENSMKLITKELSTSNISLDECNLVCLPLFRLTYYTMDQSYTKTSSAFYNDFIAYLMLHRSVGGFQQKQWSTLKHEREVKINKEGKW